MDRSIVDPRLAATLRRLRGERGVSLRALGRLVHHGKTTIHEVETGAKEPTVEMAQRLDVALRADGDLRQVKPRR